MITTVTGKNQVTLPAQLVKQLDIQPGTRINWSVDEHGIIHAHLLPPRGVLARQIAGMGQSWLREGEDPIADLLNERAQDDVAEELL